MSLMCCMCHYHAFHLDILITMRYIFMTFLDHNSKGLRYLVMKFCCFLLPYFSGYKTEFSLPKQSQRSRSVLQDGSRSLGLFRKGKIGIIAKFYRTDLVI